MIRAEGFKGLGVAHGFFTRQGGVSEGAFASLNCGLGSGDDPAKVFENRRIAMRDLGLPGAPLNLVYQVHGDAVVKVTEPIAHDARPKADGMVSDRPGLALGILTADCAPVLLADRRGKAIGACHAGWKGALGGIVDRTVAAMAELGARPADLFAAIGPCIAQDSYEVGAEFRAAFLAADPANDRFFVAGARPGKFRFDLEAYVVERLARLGVGVIEPLGEDTCADDGRFFSFRRCTLRGEPDYGRLLSAIAMT
ncbi:MAG: peptidoglycan editing factor PgeF [Alphaproteobacteria bacterium]|nr:peptidoglycan editing factor PgeF [Alphaproteobacteria bacterium]